MCTRYVRRSKTDRTDTKALLEADRNDVIHAVPIKTIDAQAMASLHRLRSAWLATRTARLNGLRVLLRELGIAIPLGARHVVPRVRELLVEPTPVPALVRPALANACDEIAALEAKMEAVEHQLRAIGRTMPDLARLQTVPGVGLLTATALVCDPQISRPRSLRDGSLKPIFMVKTAQDRRGRNSAACWN
jgi:transposase